MPADNIQKGLSNSHMIRGQKYRCFVVSILIFVVVYSQYAHGIDTSVPYSATNVDGTSPLMTKQRKSAQPFKATANSLLQGAAAQIHTPMQLVAVPAVVAEPCC